MCVCVCVCVCTVRIFLCMGWYSQFIPYCFGVSCSFQNYYLLNNGHVYPFLLLRHPVSLEMSNTPDNRITLQDDRITYRVLVSFRMSESVY
jgi:hypothetical protein